MKMVEQPIIIYDDITPKIDEQGVSFSLRSRDYKNVQCVMEKNKMDNKGVSYPKGDKTHIVRRLTPTECERLQGYPDNWTNIGEWIDSKGKKHKDADSPRYKALGNSIALPFWNWLAGRMCDQLRNDGTENLTMASLFDGIGGFPFVFQNHGCVPVWASEIEEFPIAVTKIRFPDVEESP